MKLQGRKIEGPNTEIVVIPRSSGNLVFKAQAVLDYEMFDKLCPLPEPRIATLPNGGHKRLEDEAGYQLALQNWAAKKTAYMIIESLKATEDLEWETVKYGEPETWENYKTELIGAGFSQPEISRIIEAISIACGINQKKIEEATSAFLATQAAKQNP